MALLFENDTVGLNSYAHLSMQTMDLETDLKTFKENVTAF